MLAPRKAKLAKHDFSAAFKDNGDYYVRSAKSRVKFFLALFLAGSERFSFWRGRGSYWPP